MPLTQTQVDSRAAALFAAERAADPIPPFADQGGLTRADAYRVQDALIQRRIHAGEVVAGAKVALNTRLLRNRFGAGDAAYGWLTDAMLCDEGKLPLGGLIRPRAEPQIGFLLADDVSGPEVSAHDVLDATAGIVACLEVIDSRYRECPFRAADCIADNLWAARCIVGGQLLAPRDTDPGRVGVVVWRSGGEEATGSAAEPIGGPAGAVAWFANTIARRGRGLSAGQLVLTGGLVPAIAVHRGMHVIAEFGDLGSVTLIGG